jgi:signal peptidase II
MKAAYTKPLLIIALILVVDQLIKTWVRTHIAMDFGEVRFLGSKGMLKYTLNNGMAFGWGFSGYSPWQPSAGD